MGHDLEVVAGCRSREECAVHTCPLEDRLDVSGDTIAYEDCDGVHVRDLAPGAVPAGRDYPGRVRPRLAGDFLATAAVGEDGITVSNWRAGTDAFSAATDAPFAYDVQSDGTLAYRGERPTVVDWASPAEPVVHRAAELYAGVYRVRIAGDRIAIEWGYPYDPGPGIVGGQSFDVVDLGPPPPDGEYSPAFADRDALERMDFDGTNVIWATERCRYAWLRSWDSQTGAVAVGAPPHTCVYPHIVRRAAFLDPHRDLWVKLECVPVSGAACTGWVRRVGRRGKLLKPTEYSIDERHSKELMLPRRGSLCRVGKHRARAKIVFVKRLWGDRPDDVGPNERFDRTVSVRGPTAGLPRCP